MRHLTANLKAVDEILGLSDLVVNKDAEIAAVLRILVVETIHNLYRMFVLVGKNDGFANSIAAIDGEAGGHQVLKNDIDGFLVVDIVQDFRAADITRLRVGAIVSTSCLILPDVLQLILLGSSEVFVLDALAKMLGSTVHYREIHQVVIVDGLCQFVGKVGFPIEAEQLVSASVNVLTRSGGKTDHKGVKVVQDSRVLAEDTAVGLVDDYEVETADGEFLLVRIDVVNHRLVRTERNAGGKVRLAVFIPILGIVQYTCGLLRQQLGKVLLSLVNEGRTVCQEENILSPVVADKHLAQRYGHTRFSRASGHHKKAATVHLVEVVANAVNCPFLILSVGNVLLHVLVGDGSTAA